MDDNVATVLRKFGMLRLRPLESSESVDGVQVTAESDKPLRVDLRVKTAVGGWRLDRYAEVGGKWTKLED